MLKSDRAFMDIWNKLQFSRINLRKRSVFTAKARKCISQTAYLTGSIGVFGLHDPDKNFFFTKINLFKKKTENFYNKN